MKSLDEIKKFALNKYRDFLVCRFSGKEFFPLSYQKFGKYKSGEITENFSRIHDEIIELKNNSRESLGYGYEIKWRENKGRTSGKNILPDSVYFTNESDYLKFISKENEFLILQEDSDRLLKVFPELKNWFFENPMKLISISADLERILSVCVYLKANPKPNIYIRELPAEGIDTKYIEKNSGILKQILDQILDPSHILFQETSFEKRYYFKIKPNLIRFRILSLRRFPGFPDSVRDISIPLEEFMNLNFDGIKIFITENLVNFLSFPDSENAVIIYGSGYQAVHLKVLRNILNNEIYYWGDMDIRGFDILSKFREYFPNTKSFLMDTATYEEFSHLAVTAKADIKSVPEHLTDDETELCELLIKMQNGNRLEQERIPMEYVRDQLKKL